MRQRFLRAARHRIRWTAQELADKASMPEHRYWKIETGRVAPTEEEQARLSDALGFRREMLFPDFAERAEVGT